MLRSAACICPQSLSYCTRAPCSQPPWSVCWDQFDLLLHSCLQECTFYVWTLIAYLKIISCNSLQGNNEFSTRISLIRFIPIGRCPFDPTGRVGVPQFVGTTTFASCMDNQNSFILHSFSTESPIMEQLNFLPRLFLWSCRGVRRGRDRGASRRPRTC